MYITNSGYLRYSKFIKNSILKIGVFFICLNPRYPTLSVYFDKKKCNSNGFIGIDYVVLIKIGHHWLTTVTRSDLHLSELGN